MQVRHAIGTLAHHGTDRAVALLVCCWDTRALCAVRHARVLQASTNFEGLGSPITSIDITCDGEWVLATTDTYLLLANRKALAGA